MIHDRGLSTAVGDEGGFAPAFDGTEDAVESILKAVEGAGYKPGRRRHTGLRLRRVRVLRGWASTTTPSSKVKAALSALPKSRAGYLAELLGKYPIDSIEDGCDENDWDGWKLLTDKVGDRCQLVGDDLFVTNTKFLKKGIDLGVANSILVKVNQIGTLTETLDAIEMAKGGQVHRGDQPPFG